MNVMTWSTKSSSMLDVIIKTKGRSFWIVVSSLTRLSRCQQVLL